MSEINKNPSDELPESRKESILNCLPTGNRGFIYKREIKKRIRKNN